MFFTRKYKNKLKSIEQTLCQLNEKISALTEEKEIFVTEQEISPREQEAFSKEGETLNYTESELMFGHCIDIQKDSAILAPLFAGDIDYSRFTFLTDSDAKKLIGAYLKGVGQELEAERCDLKAFQDALITAFIDQQYPKPAKLLEVGGGDSRVLPKLTHIHECWNVDKFEGNGNGICEIPDHVEYKVVRDYVGNFNKELPDNYFDCVFSISALEHVPHDDNIFKNIIDDINRVLKPDGISVHCIDVVLDDKNAIKWSNQIVEYFFDNVKTLNDFIEPSIFSKETRILHMSEWAYSRGWKEIIGKNYTDFGFPTSIQIFWQKPK